MDRQQASKLEKELVLLKFATTEKGLSLIEATARLKTLGANTLPKKSVTAFDIAIRQCVSPFFLLLLVASAISYISNEMIDGSMILGFVLINGVFGFAQEYRAERALSLLADVVKETARVIRDGTVRDILANALVPGDIVMLESGDRILADMRVISATAFSVDESTLTGESETAQKNPDVVSHIENATVRDAHNCVFMGTSVMSGSAIAVVYATGLKTELGAISHLMESTETRSTFEEGIARLSVALLWIILLAIGVVFGLHTLFPTEQITFIELALFSVALAVSVIPEALPLVTTLTLSSGALMLSRQKVVLRRLSATQDFGGITVLCTDKTGTLTENRMSVTNIYGDRESVLAFMALASPTFATDLDTTSRTFDQALANVLDEHIRAQIVASEKLNHIPFDAVRRISQIDAVWERETWTIIRGSLETVLADSDLNEIHKALFLKWATEEGEAGHRVLAVARKRPDDAQFTCLGCVSFKDPIKESSIEAISTAEKLGIRIIMLTGDSKMVAASVAEKLGMLTENRTVVTGGEWLTWNENQKNTAVRATNVFAGVTPQEKHEIIKMLQSQGECVGFLGEGINDAPALAQAEVGIAVSNATDIARESADVILLEQDLGVLIRGIRSGRALFANIVKYIQITLASNLGNFLALVTATFITPFLPMTSVQLLLVNLLTDVPMIAIAFDSVSDAEVARPKSYHVNQIIKLALILGAVSTVFDLISFSLFAPHGQAYLQTHWFIASNLTELVVIFSIRTAQVFWKGGRPSSVLTVISIIAAIITIAIPYSTFGQNFFGFQRPDSTVLPMIGGLVIAYFISTEIVKYFYYQSKNKKPHLSTV